jgi:membrane protein
MLYKWLPSVFIAWPDVWIGAFITAVLFTVGRFGIGGYLGRSAIASAYGAAGTLVVLLLSLYYSAQDFLLGAEFTCLYAKHRSSRDDGVVRIESGLQQQQSQRRPGEGTSKG